MRVDDLAAICDEDVMHAYPLYSDVARSFLDPELVPFSCALTAALSRDRAANAHAGIRTVHRAAGQAAVARSPTISWDGRVPSIWRLKTRRRRTTRRCCERLVQTGAAGAYAWCYGDYDEALFDRPPFATAIRERTFGLVRADGSEKPAVEVFRTFRKRRDAGMIHPSPVPSAADVSADEYYRAPAHHFARLYAMLGVAERRMIAPLERLSTNPLVQPSHISFTRASGAFNPGACVDRATDRVVLLVRVFEEQTRRSCLAIAISSDGQRIDEIWDQPAIAREAPYEEWGVEDARITYLADEGRYAITYTGYSPEGPRVCLITTDDLLDPERYRRHGPRIAGENKNCVIFPEKIDGQYVILHRPMPRIVCARVSSLESTWPVAGVPLVGPRARNLAQLSRRRGRAADPHRAWVGSSPFTARPHRGRQRLLDGVVRARPGQPGTGPVRVRCAGTHAGDAVRDRASSHPAGRSGELQNRGAGGLPPGTGRARRRSARVLRGGRRVRGGRARRASMRSSLRSTQRSPTMREGFLCDPPGALRCLRSPCSSRHALGAIIPAPAPPASPPLAISLAHLRHLGLDAVVNGRPRPRRRAVRRSAGLPSHAAPPRATATRGSPASTTRRARPSPTCAHSRRPATPRARDEALGLLAFVVAMEQGDGEFVNFIDARGRPNRNGAEQPQEHVVLGRARLWALGEAVRVLGPEGLNDVDGARGALDRAVARIARDVDARRLLGGSATATSEALLGLLALNARSLRRGSLVWRRARRRCSCHSREGIRPLLPGARGRTATGAKWHAWGSRSTEALARASRCAQPAGFRSRPRDGKRTRSGRGSSSPVRCRRRSRPTAR